MLETHAINPGTKYLSIEPGLHAIRELMISGALVIDSCNVELLDELRGIHRDENGEIVKLNDDLTSALRYAWMIKNRGQPRAEYAGIGFGRLPDAYQKPSRNGGQTLFAKGSMARLAPPIFALFAKAHNAGMMRGCDGVLYADALADCINERTPELFDISAWPDLYTMWGEWTYAWEHISKWRDPTDVLQVMRSIGATTVIGPLGEA